MSNEQVTTPVRETNLSFHFKALEQGTPAHAALKALVDSGSLSMEDIDIVEKQKTNSTEVVKGCWKRKSLEFAYEVPDVAQVLGEVGLEPAQAAHAQAALEEHIRQRLFRDYISPANFDEDGTIPSWDGILSEPFTKAVTSAKVSKEDLEAALKDLEPILADQTNAKAAKLIVEKAGRRFSPAATKAWTIDHLQKVRDALANATAEIDAVHYPALEMLDATLGKAINDDGEDETELLDF